MKTLKLSDIAAAVNGRLLQGDSELIIQHVIRKASSLKENSLYFLFKNKTIKQELLKENKKYAIVTEDPSIATDVDSTASVIYVENSREAYLNFIDYYRSQFHIPVIGITGTCGKTTTKDMIRHILLENKRVHATYLSQNGLHLNLHYLMGIDERTDIGVFEMGVAYPGNIKISGRYFKPTVGVITNIGEAHLEGCGTLEKYIKAKGEMLEVVEPNGILIINMDDENIKKLPLHMFKGKLFSFGLHHEADFRASNIRYENGGMSYELHYDNRVYEVVIPGYGTHNVYNSLAAISSVVMVGMEIDETITKLRNFRIMERHAKFYKENEGKTVIDDTWSCNPSSVLSGLDVLRNVSNGNTEILVLGKMQRLGRHVKEQHRKLGRTIMDTGGVDYLITIGPIAAITGEAAVESGLDPKKFISVSNAGELQTVLDQLFTNEMTLLFKMSLGKMDSSYRRVVERYRYRRDSYT